MLRQAAVRIPRNDFPLFQAFIYAPIEDISKIADFIKTATPKSDVENVAEACAAETGIDIDLIESLLFLAINLSALRRNMNKPVADMLELVTRSLEACDFPDWQEGTKEKWDERKDLIHPLLSPDGPVEVLSKVRELLSDHQQVLLDSKVLTDIRYVYSADAENIAGGLITYSLSLEYLEGGDPKNIHITVSESDVARLLKQLERAQVKAKTATGLLAKSDIPELTPKRNI